MAKRYKVELTPDAERDLESLSDWIIHQSGLIRPALEYVRRVRAYCNSFVTFPHRGTLRDDLYPGIRIIGFERRVTIAFHVTDDTVFIARIFYAGRDIEQHFNPQPEHSDDDQFD